MKSGARAGLLFACATVKTVAYSFSTGNEFSYIFKLLSRPTLHGVSPLIRNTLIFSVGDLLFLFRIHFSVFLSLIFPFSVVSSHA